MVKLKFNSTGSEKVRKKTKCPLYAENQLLILGKALNFVLYIAKYSRMKLVLTLYDFPRQLHLKERNKFDINRPIDLKVSNKTSLNFQSHLADVENVQKKKI